MNSKTLERDSLFGNDNALGDYVSVLWASLSIESVAAHFGIRLTGVGAERRGNVCPVCGLRTRSDAVSWNLPKKVWYCFAGRHGGGLFHAIAGLSRQDINRDFPAIIALAGQIAGLAQGDDLAEYARRAEASRWRSRAWEAQAHARRSSGLGGPGMFWAACASRSERGEAYLRTRGLARTPDVRFTRECPCLAMYDDSGRVINVLRRAVPPSSAPKVMGLYRCPTDGTLLHHLGMVTTGKDVAVVEGLMDSVAASLAWPRGVVLGANGATMYPLIARLAAPRVRSTGGRLYLCVDSDRAGEEAGREAVRSALACGLVLHQTLMVVDLGGHHDLCDAYAAGWRPA